MSRDKGKGIRGKGQRISEKGKGIRGKGQRISEKGKVKRALPETLDASS